MAKLEIMLCGEPVLRKRARPVKEVTPELRQLFEDMKQTMIEAPGVGLAAPQVGAPIRAIVVREDVEENCPIHVLLNPRIVARAGEQEGQEGCLSLPTLQAAVTRSTRVKVRAQNPEGEEVELEGEGLLARCLQHEIDHLDGVLFIDRADPDTLAWMVPDEKEEGGYRLEPTTRQDVLDRFARMIRARKVPA
jgi:peptide deformylase